MAGREGQIRRKRVAGLVPVAAAVAVLATACLPVNPSPVYLRGCAKTLSASTSGPVASTAVVEASGIVASRSQPGIYWVHNDSGDAARIFAIDTTGAVRATYVLAGATATDFEDIALVPSGVAGVDQILVGDIGDNTRTRTEVQVLRFTEPVVPASATTETVPAAAIATLRLRYPDGARNAESLLADPRNGQLTIVMKRQSNEAIRIYRAPANLASGSLTTLTDVGQLNLPGTGANATAIDMSRDARTIAVRTYANVFLYNVGSGVAVHTALSTAPCAANAAAEPQGEAIAFHADDLGFVTLSEGVSQPLNHRDV